MSTQFASKITSFTNLITWQELHKLAVLIYRITDTFPEKENFVLISQMRRAAISISSNIAEGFSRVTKKEKIQFYYIAKGSLTELHNQLLLARDIGYIPEDHFSVLIEQIALTGRLLQGLIRSLKQN